MLETTPPDLSGAAYVSTRSAWWAGRRLGPSVFRAVGGAVFGPPLSASDVPPATAVLPLNGAVIPGLHDNHVHTMLGDVRALRAHGVASVVDLGGVDFSLQSVAAAGARADSDLPRVAYAGAYLTVPHGYPSLAPWALPGSCRAVASPGHAAEAVQEQLDAGATRIKAVVSTDHDTPTFDVPILTAVADAAHAAGVELVVHVQGPGAADIALDAGSDVFAHTPWTQRLGDRLIERAANQTAWISTIDIRGYGLGTPEVRKASRNLARFVAAGGTVRYGTDFGAGPHPPGVNMREVQALQAAGLDIDAVLTSMTLGPEDLPASWLPWELPTDPTQLSAALTLARVLAPAPG